MHLGAIEQVTDVLQQSGIAGAPATQAALGAIRRQMDRAAITSAFQDSFLLVCTCFLFASLPMFYLLSQGNKQR